MVRTVVKKANGKTIHQAHDIIKHVPAGFPSPASDLNMGAIDLNEMLVERPAATYFVEVQGHSMIGAGIFSGDTLVVDRSLEPHNGSVVVAVVDGTFTVKKYTVGKSGMITLVAENPKYPPILVKEGMDVQIWGVVRWVLHRVS